MRIVHAAWFRLRALLQRDAVNAEFDAELRDHIDRETEANTRRGLSPDEARRRALADFGGVERFKESLRDERSVRWLEDIVTDVRHSARLMRKNVLFSSAVIGTLALGIGATTTIFALVNGVLLRPLPYANANEIISIAELVRGELTSSVRYHNFEAWRSETRAFTDMAAYSQTSAILTGSGDPVDVDGGLSTASLFTVLGANAALGRVYSAADEMPGAPEVVVLSHALWNTRFGRDSGVLNRTIVLSGVTRRVIGVMPAEFDLPRRAAFWIPWHARAPGAEALEVFFQAIGRIRDGVPLQTAQVELQAIVKQRDATSPETLRGRQVAVMTLHDSLFGSASKPLSLLMSAVAMLLLIACANVANLTIARSAARRREFAVRLALGASRARITRQLLIESSLLALVGGTIGTLMPFALVGAFAKLSPASVAEVGAIHIDAAVPAFAATATILAVMLFGLAPAVAESRTRPAAALASGSARISGDRSQASLRSALVILEVATALTLVTGAGLFTKSFTRALAVNPGFQADRLMATRLQLPRTRYTNRESMHAFFSDVAAKTRTIPGVQAVSLSNTIPLHGFAMSWMMKRTPLGEDRIMVALSHVDANFANVLGLRLLQGRTINESDRQGAPPVVMITAMAAQKLFPGRDAVGQVLPEPLTGTTSAPTIIGVVSDVVQRSVEEEQVPQLFFPAAQVALPPRYIIARTTLSEAAYREALKPIIASVDPQQPITELISMTADLSNSLAARRFNSLLINSFAALALLLAIVGLYGLMAFAVVSRTRELGIRIALGARTENVMRLVLRQGVILTALGIAGGVALSFILSRTLSSMLYDVTAHDPVVFVCAPLILALVALAACYFPARRATRVNPTIALRQDG